MSRKRRGHSREEIMAKRHATLVATCRCAPLGDGMGRPSGRPLRWGVGVFLLHTMQHELIAAV